MCVLTKIISNHVINTILATNALMNSLLYYYTKSINTLLHENLAAWKFRRTKVQKNTQLNLLNPLTADVITLCLLAAARQTEFRKTAMVYQTLQFGQSSTLVNCVGKLNLGRWKTFRKGTRHLNGKRSLNYVNQKVRNISVNPLDAGIFYVFYLIPYIEADKV